MCHDIYMHLNSDNYEDLTFFCTKYISVKLVWGQPRAVYANIA